VEEAVGFVAVFELGGIFLRKEWVEIGRSKMKSG